MRNARIAIVDDDATFGQYLSVLLGARGYDVETFARGEDLLRAMRAGLVSDVVLLDVLMPGMDGLETLRALREVQANIQVIMLSGTQVPATIVDAVRLGAIDYVVKPDDPEGLGEAALEAAIRSAVANTRLRQEVAVLRQIAEDGLGPEPYWGAGPAMQPVRTMIERVADSDVSVLISGESGVGKEVIARELHRQSSRRSRNFVKVTCAALPSELLESELFGHDKGAFTGAHSTRVGKFEFAHGGTIMLDEIGEMPLPLQAKLLHILQDRSFSRLGSNRPIAVDVRVIAATNRDLTQMIRTGEFREDLYYRLQVIEVRVPPLRDRRDEILPLFEFFLAKYATKRGVTRPSAALRDAFVAYPWPGNVRELENVVRRYVHVNDEAMILQELERGSALEPTAPAAAPPAAGRQDASPRQWPIPPPPDEFGPDQSLLDYLDEVRRSVERDILLDALDRTRWNRRKAAVMLGVSYKTLLNRMKACDVAGPA